MGREVLPVVAEHAEQQVELVDCATPAVLDQRQRLAGLGRMIAHDSLRGAGLDDHQRDVMGDDVVQLTGDALTFCDDGLAGLEVLLALEQAGAGGGCRPPSRAGAG